MKHLRKVMAVTVIGSCFLLTGCANDNLSKGLAIAGLAGGGAFLGHHLAGRGNRGMGALIGGGLGGGLGALLLFGKK